VSLEGNTYEHALKFLFKTSNNKAKYAALLTIMDLCHALRAECLRALSNSQLVLSRLKGEYEAVDVTIVAYLSKLKEKSQRFKNFEIEHGLRSENQQGDALLKLASSSLNGHPKST